MAKDANLYIRIEQETKSKAEKLFSSFGITITDAVNMFLHKSIMVGGLPFELRQPVPNSETLEAMKEVEDMINGKIPSKAQSVDDFFKELEEENDNTKVFN